MKPSIQNLVKLLIGKSAVTSAYVTKMNEEKAFEITDAKVERGLVSVKGKNTPWLTENVISVLMIQFTDLTNEEIRVVLQRFNLISKITKSKFENLRDSLLNNHNNTFPLGSIYFVENDFCFINFPSGWKIVKDIFHDDERGICVDDVSRHYAYILNNWEDSPNNSPLLNAAIKADYYFNQSGFSATTGYVAKYLNEQCGVEEKDSITLARFLDELIPDDVGSNKLFNALVVRNISSEREKYPLQKEIVDILIKEYGMNTADAKFAAKLIKPVKEK